MSKLSKLNLEVLANMQQCLARELDLQKANKLSLDLTRGKPATDQLDLGAGLETVIDGNYFAADGSDTRNYGQLRGIAEVRDLGAEILDVAAAEIICWGNSSLNLMYLTAELARSSGLWGDDRAWCTSSAPKMLTPVPGYDRHFTLCEDLDLEMVNVPMTQDGPDMTVVERLVSDDSSIKGIWCVPKYSNPTGCTYSDDVVAAMAALPKAAAADDFVVFWDNAYAVHDLGHSPQKLKPIMPLARQAGTADHIVLFASTSKITYASGGLGFLAASERVLANIEKHLSVTSIGPDKVNQLRHARFLGGRVAEHMALHAQLLKPKFQLVLETLAKSLADLDIARWTRPEGGYFVSLDTRPGLAREVGKLAAEVGLALTPAGATFPHGADPQDSNLRIAPTFASLTELKTAMEIFIVCLKLASVNDEIERRATL